MFHFPRSSSGVVCIRAPVSRHDSGWVSPFGHLRINACLPLPVAYRSLPRPSSPADAKAFTMRPFTSLTKIILATLRRRAVKRRAGVSSSSSFGEELYYPSLYAIVKEPPRGAGKMVSGPDGLPAFAEPTARPSDPGSEWACLESNQGPRPYQGRALTKLSYTPLKWAAARSWLGILPAGSARLRASFGGALFRRRRRKSGGNRVRTGDPELAKLVLCQLSYAPGGSPASV